MQSSHLLVYVEPLVASWGSYCSQSQVARTSIASTNCGCKTTDWNVLLTQERKREVCLYTKRRERRETVSKEVVKYGLVRKESVAHPIP